MLLPAAAIVVGLVLLVWSADRFVDGAAATARYFGMPALLIGIIIVGFGTSAPEMVVSALAASDGNPGIALGNAYGSNITNIGLILGLTAIISPVAVSSQVLRKELPVLLAVTALAMFQVWDNEITRLDAFIMIAVFALIMGYTIYQSLQERNKKVVPDPDEGKEDEGNYMPLSRAIMWLVIGLLLLIASSRMLVWGAVEIATALGVSDLIIGLTIVAVGTSLPELASSIIAAMKGEHDIALGNIIGSNLFNTLAVVGIAGSISPMIVEPEVFYRDMTVMAGLTLFILIVGIGIKGPGRINRVEGGLMLATYIGYTAYLVSTTFVAAAPSA